MTSQKSVVWVQLRERENTYDYRCQAIAELGQERLWHLFLMVDQIAPEARSRIFGCRHGCVFVESAGLKWLKRICDGTKERIEGF